MLRGLIRVRAALRTLGDGEREVSSVVPSVVERLRREGSGGDDAVGPAGTRDR